MFTMIASNLRCNQSISVSLFVNLPILKIYRRSTAFTTFLWLDLFLILYWNSADYIPQFILNFLVFALSL